jgi:hypothetical protein
VGQRAPTSAASWELSATRDSVIGSSRWSLLIG